MKVLIINQITPQGNDTKNVTHATTLNNAFKKASIHEWQYFRIYQVYSNRAPHIVFESEYPCERLRRTEAVEDFSVLLEEKDD